jgi:hypothetical protein
LDKRFFDSSLIEMKSQASSSSTIDYDSTEEVWIKRSDVATETARRRKVSLAAGIGLISCVWVRLWCVVRVDLAPPLPATFDSLKRNQFAKVTQSPI